MASIDGVGDHADLGACLGELGVQHGVRRVEPRGGPRGLDDVGAQADRLRRAQASPTRSSSSRRSGHGRDAATRPADYAAKSSPSSKITGIFFQRRSSGFGPRVPPDLVFEIGQPEPGRALYRSARIARSKASSARCEVRGPTLHRGLGRRDRRLGLPERSRSPRERAEQRGPDRRQAEGRQPPPRVAEPAAGRGPRAGSAPARSGSRAPAPRRRCRSRPPPAG